MLESRYAILSLLKAFFRRRQSCFLPCAPTQPLVFRFFAIRASCHSFPPVFLRHNGAVSFVCLSIPLIFLAFASHSPPLPVPPARARLSLIRLLFYRFIHISLIFKAFRGQYARRSASQTLFGSASCLALPIVTPSF